MTGRRRQHPRASDRGLPMDCRFRLSGRRAVLEALRAGFVKSIEINDRAHGTIISEIRGLAGRLSVPVLNVSSATAVDDDDQGVVADAELPGLRSDLRSYVQTVAAIPSPLFLMLDGIEDPHNFGAILRSAEAAAVSGVIVRLRRQAPVSQVVVRSSAGAAYLVPLFGVTNLARTLRLMSEHGFWSVAATGSPEAIPHRKFDWNRPLVLIVGSEGPGISDLLRRSADAQVRIPMHGQIESLNVSVATGILLYEAAAMRFDKSDLISP